MQPRGSTFLAFVAGMALVLSFRLHARGEPLAAADVDGQWEELARFHCPEAKQAAVADERFFYAVSNRSVAKYDRSTGQRVATSQGPAIHLNSGVLHLGNIYLAHSNYPAKPDRSDIKLLDPQSMELSLFHDFGQSEGSLTWALPEGNGWWCHFAYYGAENRRSYLAYFDKDWRETKRYTFPQEALQAFGKYSASGGLKRNGTWIVTGHDRKELHLLKVPVSGSVLEFQNTLPAPFAGQAIADDPLTGGIIGIDRSTKEIIVAR